MRISDWSSDVCSSDLPRIATLLARSREEEPELEIRVFELPFAQQLKMLHDDLLDIGFALSNAVHDGLVAEPVWTDPLSVIVPARHPLLAHRSEEHTSELQSLMRISYAGFCLKKKK